eukprot:1142062-Pelagomonas_calceolata.AAC.3
MQFACYECFDLEVQILCVPSYRAMVPARCTWSCNKCFGLEVQILCVPSYRAKAPARCTWSCKELNDLSLFRCWPVYAPASHGGGTDKNVTYRVTSNPNDPFGLKLPQFGGSLMPHELCAQDGNSSGLFMGDELALSPNPATWVVGSSAQLRDALRGISDHGFMNNSARKELEPIAMAIIVKDVSVADGGAAALSGIPFAEDVLLHGSVQRWQARTALKSQFQETKGFADCLICLEVDLNAFAT